MIADRHPFVVGKQRIVGPEHAADVGGVVDRGVEIGVVADRGGEEQLGVLHGNQDPVAQPAVGAIRGRVARERRRGRAAELEPRFPPQRQQGIEHRRGARVARGFRGTGEVALVVAGGEVEDPIADRHPDARRLVLVRERTEDPEREILDWKVRMAAGGFDPGGQGGR